MTRARVEAQKAAGKTVTKPSVKDLEAIHSQCPARFGAAFARPQLGLGPRCAARPACPPRICAQAGVQPAAWLGAGLLCGPQCTSGVGRGCACAHARCARARLPMTPLTPRPLPAYPRRSGAECCLAAAFGAPPLSRRPPLWPDWPGFWAPLHPWARRGGRLCKRGQGGRRLAATVEGRAGPVAASRKCCAALPHLSLEAAQAGAAASPQLLRAAGGETAACGAAVPTHRRLH